MKVLLTLIENELCLFPHGQCFSWKLPVLHFSPSLHTTPAACLTYWKPNQINDKQFSEIARDNAHKKQNTELLTLDNYILVSILKLGLLNCYSGVFFTFDYNGNQKGLFRVNYFFLWE